jgi:hypothetical protein
MMTPSQIRDWGDGYVAVKHRAEDVRGRIDFVPAELPVSVEHWERWPRTTGADALRIAAFLDPHLRRLGQHGNCAGIESRWRTCVADLERWALPSPGGEYVDNRRFWSCVLAVCVQLSSSLAPLPSQASWDALISEIGDAPRNGIPKEVPFGPFAGIDNYADLFLAQYTHLKSVRGSDPASSPGLLAIIPRTTNADVKQLAAFWSAQLRSVQHIVGHDGVAGRWATTAAEVEGLTKSATPTATYPKNETFWRALSTVRTQVHVADGAPSKGARILESLGYGVSRLPETLENTAKAIASGTGGLLRGLFSGLGTPLLIGGGLVGAYLLFGRSRGRGGSTATAEV